jgi:H+-transporting ATPase
MLEVTIALELSLGKWLEAGVVTLVLAFNAVLGLVQQGRAQGALALLRQRLSINARVARDGSWQLVPAAGLVPADLVHVRVGDFVPADLQLSDGDVLVDESTLTGESLPAQRTAGDSIFSGSTITRGEATGVVTATGARTGFGQTAELVRTAGSTDQLAGVVLRMVRVFIVVDLALAIAGCAFLLLRNAGTQDVVAYGVVLLLASVPVALPAAFALAGALGAQHLAELGILTARLTTVQAAASMDVLCVDKTGTITLNRLTLTRVVAREPLTTTNVLSWAAAASDAATQDPIDLAILRAATEQPREPRPRLRFTPFDPSTKRSEAEFATDAGVMTVTKGAPQVIAALCGEPPDPQVEGLAELGARVLAVAVREGDRPWRAAGLVALADRHRPEAADLVRRLHDLGVRVVMVTGDSAATAQAIAEEVGIQGHLVSADTMRSLPLAELETLPFGVVAEVLPADKHQLVHQLQRAGHVVGMTGDGVNDAPALRQADVGVAVAGATDVAKSAAGVVLTREGLANIVAMVEESRRIHQRSLTYALNVSIKKLEIPVLLAFGLFAWQQLVFTPLLMALLLLGNDVVSMAIVTDRAGYSRGPDRWQLRNMIAGAVIVAVPLVAASVTVLAVGRDVWPGLDLEHLRTLIFVTLVVSSQAGIYVVRTRHHAWTVRPSGTLLLASAGAVAAAVALALSGTLMAGLPATAVFAAAATVLVGAALADLLKVATFTTLGLHRL